MDETGIEPKGKNRNSGITMPSHSNQMEKLDDKKQDAWWAGNSPFILLDTEKDG